MEATDYNHRGHKAFAISRSRGMRILSPAGRFGRLRLPPGCRPDRPHITPIRRLTRKPRRRSSPLLLSQPLVSAVVHAANLTFARPDIHEGLWIGQRQFPSLSLSNEHERSHSTLIRRQAAGLARRRIPQRYGACRWGSDISARLDIGARLARCRFATAAIIDSAFL
jgi:hypothetical protein